MSDQFSEWDKFYAAYQRTLTPDGAMQSYKYHRKQQRYREAGQKTRRTTATKTASSSVTQGSEAVAPSSLMMMWVIVEEPSGESR